MHSAAEVALGDLENDYADSSNSQKGIMRTTKVSLEWNRVDEGQNECVNNVMPHSLGGSKQEESARETRKRYKL
jgi:hypothetical protein